MSGRQQSRSAVGLACLQRHHLRASLHQTLGRTAGSSPQRVRCSSWGNWSPRRQAARLQPGPGWSHRTPDLRDGCCGGDESSESRELPTAERLEPHLRDPDRSPFHYQRSARTPPICHRTPGRAQVTGLALRRDTIARVPSRHHQASKTPAHFGITKPPTILRTFAKSGAGTAFDRAREILGDPKTPHSSMGPPAQARTTQSASSHEPSPAPHGDLTLPLGRIAAALEKGLARSSKETVVGVQVSVAYSEEGYAGMSTDGAGSSRKLCGRAAAVTVFCREHPAVESARKFIPLPKKNDKSAEVDSVSHAHATAGVSARQPGKGKRRDGEDPAWGGWILRDLRSVWLGFRSSLGAVGVTCSTASSLSGNGINWPSIAQNRLSLSFPISNLVSVGSRRLMVGHVLDVAEVWFVTWGVASSAVFGGYRQVACTCLRHPSGAVYASSQRESQKKRAARRLSSSRGTSAAACGRYSRTS